MTCRPPSAWLLTAGLVVSLALRVSADSPAELLEKGIYAEETQGDLATAIDIYKKISAQADAERPTVAQALFRLGMCYRKEGRSLESQQAFERLAREYPEQSGLLIRIPVAGVPPLSLSPAPWAPGETLVLCVRQSSEMIHAFLEKDIVIFRVEQTGDDATSAMRLTRQWTTASAVIDLSPEAFQPTRRRFHHPDAGLDLEASYTPAAVDLVRNSKAAARIPTPKGAYDYDQLIHLIRRLPLQGGYSTALPVLDRYQPLLHEVRLNVVGRENVTVPAGTFETFRVAVALTAGYGPQQLWYSTDSRRLPVKVQEKDASGYGSLATWELAQLGATDGQQRVTFRDESTGLGLSAPPGWFVVPSSQLSEPLRVHIIDPSARALGFLRVQSISAKNPAHTPVEVAREHAEWAVKHYRGGYTLDDNRVETFTVGGMTAARLTGRYRNLGGRRKVDHRVFLVHRGHRINVNWVAVDEDVWEDLRAAAEDVVQTLRMP